MDVRGTLYFDHVLIDNAARLPAPRLINPSALDGEDIALTKSGYIFVGPGTVRGITLIAAANAVPPLADKVELFDTNSLPYSHHDLRAAAKASTAETVFSPPNREYSFSRGCYAVRSNAVPATVTAQAIIHIGVVQEMDWMGGFGDEE